MNLIKLIVNYKHLVRYKIPTTKYSIKFIRIISLYLLTTFVLLLVFQNESCRILGYVVVFF